MAGDPNSTSTRWLAFPQSLAWIRQDRPGATDEWAWEELQRELLKAACGASDGVPIDKFRYPWAGRMVDLIVLLQNNHLTFANIWWQHVECNFDWLKRDWPAPAPLEEPAHSASTGAEAEESPAEPAAAGPEPAQGADEVRPEAPVLAVNAPAPTTTAMSPVALPAEAETASTPDTETTPPPPVVLPAEPLVVEESASVSEWFAPNDKLEALGRLGAAPDGTSEDAAARHPGDRPVEINWAGAKAHVDRIVARYGRRLPRKKDGDPNLARAVGLMERFFKKNEPPRGDETEPCRPFDTEGRTDQEHPEAIVRATPVKTRPLFDLEKLRIYLEKLRASFKLGPSQGEPTAIVSPVRYAQSLLRRIEQLARELKEIASRAGTTSNVFELFTSWKSDKANRTADVAADIATLSQKPATEDKTQSTPIDCTVDAAAEIATLKQKLTAAEARIQWNAKSTPTLDDLRERMAVLLRDPPTLDAAARPPLATAQVTHGRATESANAAPEWPQLVAAFIARELGFVGMA